MFNIINSGELLNCYCSSKKCHIGWEMLKSGKTLTVALLRYAANEMGHIIYPPLVFVITPNFSHL